MTSRERRTLTPEEQAACAEFKRLLLSSEKSQETIAGEIGVTQGAVWQWADGMIPIAARRARAAAKAVGADPSVISVAFRQLHLPEVTASERPHSSATPSHLLELDPDTLYDAITLVVHFDEVRAGPYTPRAQAARIADLYARIAADGGRLTKQHNDEFESEVQQRAQGKENGDRSSQARRQGQSTR